jgi:hypothetical protein
MGESDAPERTVVGKTIYAHSASLCREDPAIGMGTTPSYYLEFRHIMVSLTGGAKDIEGYLPSGSLRIPLTEREYELLLNQKNSCKLINGRTRPLARLTGNLEIKIESAK